MKFFYTIVCSILLSGLGQCTFIAEMFSKKHGVVTFYNSIPSKCPKSRGLKQKVIKPVYSHSEMINHYGISFLIRFQDKISPDLYGVLYHQNKDKNLYCMALPDGRFALFHDQIINSKSNIIQEICYPLKNCLQQ